MQQLTPVGAAERVELIDVLRGFALLGILVVNFWGSAGTRMPKVDAVVNEGLDILVSSSFYPLFSFLFGLGFAVQWTRARERGAAIARVYVRRLLALFLIGSVHCVLIWNGDILVPYAIGGFLLIPLSRATDRWLMLVAVLVILGGWFESQIWNRVDQIAASPDAAQMRELEQGERGARNGVSAALAERIELTDAGRVEAYRITVVGNAYSLAGRIRNRLSRSTLLWEVLACFIVGFVAGRRRWIQSATDHRTALAWIAGASAATAIGSTVTIYTIEPNTQPWRSMLYTGQDLGFTAFYISAIALAFVTLPRIAAALRPFAHAGRLGLTNYLMQSLVMTIPFAAYGFRLTEPSTTMWLLLNITFFFAVQIPLSRWWSGRYRFGPAEWVWRSLTYAEPQPMRRRLDLVPPESSA